MNPRVAADICVKLLQLAYLSLQILKVCLQVYVDLPHFQVLLSEILMAV